VEVGNVFRYWADCLIRSGESVDALTTSQHFWLAFNMKRSQEMDRVLNRRRNKTVRLENICQFWMTTKKNLTGMDPFSNDILRCTHEVMSRVAQSSDTLNELHFPGLKAVIGSVVQSW
jgi:hypothetical protein